MSELSRVVGEGMGAVSVCWTKIGDAGIFQSEQAAGIVDEVVAWIEAHYEPKDDGSEVLDSSIGVWVDSLTHDERVRLECLALAVPSMTNLSAAGNVIERAAAFEAYIRGSQTSAHNYDERGRRLTIDEVKERLQAQMKTPENARREIYENVHGVTDYPPEGGAERITDTPITQ